MAKSIFEALYYGEINPFEWKMSRDNPESIELEQKIADEKEYFKDKLSADDYERFLKLEDLYTESSHRDLVEYFSNGFALST